MLLTSTLLQQAFSSHYLDRLRITYYRAGAHARAYTVSEGLPQDRMAWFPTEITSFYVFGGAADVTPGVNYLDTTYSRYCAIDPKSDALEMISSHDFNRNRAMI